MEFWEFQWGIVEGPRTHLLKASYLLAESVLLRLMSSAFFRLDRRMRLLGRMASSSLLFRLRQLGRVSKHAADAPTSLVLGERVRLQPRPGSRRCPRIQVVLYRDLIAAIDARSTMI